MQALPCSLKTLRLQLPKCLVFLCILMLLLITMVVWVSLGGHAA
jgi:hypothetical protein